MTGTISKLKRVGASRNSFLPPRCYRIVKIRADNQTRTTADPLPDDLPNTLIKTRLTHRTNMSQAGLHNSVPVSAGRTVALRRSRHQPTTGESTPTDEHEPQHHEDAQARPDAHQAPAEHQ